MQLRPSASTVPNSPRLTASGASYRVAALPFALTGLLQLGCGSDSDDNGGTPDAAPISAECMEATTKSDLTWIQDNIFSSSCAAFGSCHMGAAGSADGLNLEAGMSQTNLVGIDSTRDSRFKLVAAGDADNSYLLMVLGRNPSNPDATINRLMPPGQPLCDEKVEAVARRVNSL